MAKGLQADNIMANMSASILREIVASTLNVKATEVKLSGEMPLNAVYDGCSTGGELYSDSNVVTAFSFSPKEGLREVPAIITHRQTASNANGTWENSYGYTAEYLAEVCPDALFFVIKEENDYWDCNGRDEYSLTHTIYKAPDFREHWSKVEEEDIRRWSSWLEA